MIFWHHFGTNWQTAIGSRLRPSRKARMDNHPDLPELLGGNVDVIRTHSVRRTQRTPSALVILFNPCPRGSRLLFFGATSDEWHKRR